MLYIRTNQINRIESLFINLLNCTLAGGFNQPIMCGGEPRAMLKKARGKADRPIYTIQICIPKHG